jgi:precorrin-2/cobalt-factor-2 C20-methyltransferase
VRSMLVGLGLGPGDPELLTLKAVRLLRKADAVFVTRKTALDLISPYCEAHNMNIPLAADESAIDDALIKGIEKIAPLARNCLAVIGIVGDPGFCSISRKISCLVREKFPDIDYVTIPGISSISALASALGIDISNSIIVHDDREPALKIIPKVRYPRETAARLMKDGYKEFILIERMFTSHEKVYQNDALPEQCDCFSILYAMR